MYRIFVLFILMAIVAGCGSGRGGTDRGITGTSGTTTGTGTAAPSGTIGTGGTADPVAPGAVIPKEGEGTLDPDDSAITEVIVARLKEAGFGNIHVKTDEGLVTLKGTAASQAQIEQIIKLVQAVPEVESVTSELTVQQ